MSDSPIEPLSIPSRDGREYPAVLALPDGVTGPAPGVVVIHDITGLREDTERHCRRFAEAGYAALAPDLYGGGSVGCIVATLVAMMRGTGQPFEVLSTARALLADRPEVDGDRIGIVGFCMGGGFALLAAADDAYAVAAPFYGMVPASAERLRGVCPTLGQFGGLDRPFRKHAKRLSAHLEELGVPHEVLMHDGVGHGFMNDHHFSGVWLGRHLPIHSAYDAATEEVAWRALLGFFERHMGDVTSTPSPGGARRRD